MSAYDDAFAQSFGDSKKSSSSDYDEIAKKIFQTSSASQQAEATPEQVKDFGGNLRFATPFGTLDTRIPLPQFLNKGLAQVGSGIADLGVAFSSPDVVDEKRRLDRPLLDSAQGKILNFVGKAAPAMAIPGGGVLGGMAAGGAIGLMEPVGTGESRTSNTLTSAALGGVIPGLVKGAQWMARPNAETSKLAQSALDQGIPVGLSDITQNKLTKGLRSVLDDVPFVGGIGERANTAKQSGFDLAAAKVIGENSRLTPDVMSGARSRIGGELNKVWENNSLKFDPQYIQDLQRISQDAATKLNPEQAATVGKVIQNLKDKAVNSANGWEASGPFVNNWQSELRMMADGEKGLAQNLLSDLRKSTLSAFNRGVTGDEATALAKSRGQWGAMKTLEPILNKAEAGVAGRSAGEVSPALLSQQIATKYGSTSRSPFGDLPQIGSQFLVDRTSRAGGSPRAMVQNSILGTALTSGAGGLGAILAGVPGAAVGAGAAAGTGALLEKILSSPSIAQSVLTPAVKRGLLDNPELGPALLELMKQSANRLPVMAGMGLLSTPSFE